MEKTTVKPITTNAAEMQATSCNRPRTPDVEGGPEVHDATPRGQQQQRVDQVEDLLARLVDGGHDVHALVAEAVQAVEHRDGSRRVQPRGRLCDRIKCNRSH